MSPAPSFPNASAPSVRRRLAAFLYEGVLLFGVLMVASLFYAGLTDMRDARIGLTGFRVFLFVLLGGYFVWFWTHDGQTVAMKTWHIRLVGPDGRAPSMSSACLRYLAAWLWFAPGLTSLWISGLMGSGRAISLVLTVGVLAYAALAWLDPNRQFLHDKLCQTRLVDTRAKQTAAPASKQPDGLPT